MVRRIEPPRQFCTRPDAIFLGLSGMLGAGLFVGIAPAAAAAGPWLLVGIPLAALTAACCAFATATLSARYQGADGVYLCIRDQMGESAARIAASTFLVGQIAAMAAIAGTVGEYLLPAAAPGVAATVLVSVVLLATAGVRIRRRAAWLWVAPALLSLGVVVAASFAIAPATDFTVELPRGDYAHGGVGAAGLLFFAYLGFERLAASAGARERNKWTEVRFGLVVSLGIATGLAALTGAALLYQLGPARLALSPVPLLDALSAAGAPDLRALIAVGVGAALIPVLLRALESFRVTALAVAFDGALPSALLRRAKSGTPVFLDLLAALGAGALALFADPAVMIGFASCCILVHYAFVQAGTRVLLDDDRTWQRRATCLGMGLAVVLAMSMPLGAMLGTLVVAVAGPVVAGLTSRRWRLR